MVVFTGITSYYFSTVDILQKIYNATTSEKIGKKPKLFIIAM